MKQGVRIEKREERMETDNIVYKVQDVIKDAMNILKDLIVLAK